MSKKYFFNDNISRELEMLLIQNGFFNHNVYIN